MVSSEYPMKIGLRARFRRARKPHFFQYVCAMTYYIQAHHATSLHNLPKPHVWQCVCVMQFSINIIMELAYATLQHCITHVSSTFFTLLYEVPVDHVEGGGGGGHQRVLRKSWMEGGGGGWWNVLWMPLPKLMTLQPLQAQDSPPPPPSPPPHLKIQTVLKLLWCVNVRAILFN